MTTHATRPRRALRGPQSDDQRSPRQRHTSGDLAASTEDLVFIGYVRRSRPDRRKREDEAHGITAQRAAIKREAAHRGWSIVWAEPDDGHTGANVNRPGLVWALGELAQGKASGLVVSKLDRLSRSVVDLGGILRTAQSQGWSIVILDLGIDTSTPNGRLVAHVLVAVAEWERAMIAQRTRDALTAARDKGVRLGRPSGIDPETVAAILELRDEGCTLQSIADVLNDQAIPCAQGGKRWRTSTVRDVLTRTHEQTLNDESTNADARLIA